MALRIFFSLLFVIFLYTTFGYVIPQERPILRFNSNGKFKILQITDPHFDADLRNTLLSQMCIRTIMSMENPDFVAYTGDMVTGHCWDGSEGWFRRQWKDVTRIVTEWKTPYAVAMGNHDVEADLSREQIVRLDQENPLSLTQLGPEGPLNSTNYVIPVYSSKDPSRVIMNMWFFDSGNHGCMGDVSLGFGCIEPEVVEWYKQESDRLEKEQGEQRPAIAFFHIPPQEFMEGWTFYNTTGHKVQVTSCSGVNTGIVQAFLEKGNMIGLFVGHDHPNDFSVDYKGLYMAYGRKTGFGGYGIPGYIRKGGRVLEFTEEPFSFKTYIAREDFQREVLENMHWANGTQSVCNGS